MVNERVDRAGSPGSRRAERDAAAKGRAVRRAGLVAFVLLAVCLLATRPGYAEPAIPSGATVAAPAATQPTPPGSAAVPSGAAGSAVPPGPLGTRIAAASAAVEQLGERLKQLQVDTAAAAQTNEDAQRAWTAAAAELDRIRVARSSQAAAAYRLATRLGPADRYANEARQLSLLAPGLAARLEHRPGPEELARGGQSVRNASAEYGQARDAWLALDRERAAARQAYDQSAAALAELRQHNAAGLALIDAERDAFERSLGASRSPGANAHGPAANPGAVTAVDFALQQLGKAYEWGAEGPQTFDCSGLVFAAYQKAAVVLPRVASAQYRATTPVPIDQLLPGDLLFFGPDPSDWQTIHHVAIYLGEGRMLHAPSTGDVVRIAPIWWSEFFGATRVLPALPTPGPTPGPTPRPTPGPTSSASPSASSSAPAPSAAPSPAPSSDPPSPAPSNDPPSPAPSAGTPSPSASSTPQNSAAPTPAAGPPT